MVHALAFQEQQIEQVDHVIVSPSSESDLAHGHWLRATQTQDARICAPILAGFQPDWLIVDHYAIDACWELFLKPHYRRLMAIDDLADRPHACAILLDQTFGRNAEDYKCRVPTECHLICGSQYALLRPEFAALRPYSLQRRIRPVLRELLISMGGVDKDNATGQVLQVLRASPLPVDCQITVVMGATAPWLDEVRTLAHDMPWPTRVLTGVSDVARLMADSDLAIGAAGATSWERCCLGLPTIVLVLAANQYEVANGLEQAGAAVLVSSLSNAESQLAPLLKTLLSAPQKLHAMSKASAAIVDGMGVRSVIALLESQK